MIAEQLVLLAEEIVSILFAGTKAWALTCRDSAPDTPFMLLAPIKAIHDSVARAYDSDSAHDQISELLTEWTRIASRAIAAMEWKPHESDIALDAFRCEQRLFISRLQMFGHTFISKPDEWDAISEEMRRHLDELMAYRCEAAAAASDKHQQPLWNQPRALLPRLKLLNACRSLGIALQTKLIPLD